MAERITDEQVADLLAILRKDVAVDAKVQQVNAVKSGIKQHNVPDGCVAPLFDALRIASSSPYSNLVNAGFTALNHLLTRLSRQDPKLLTREAKQTLPLVVDKMGDQKDKFRTLAIQAMATMYTQMPAEAERFVRNTALAGKNPRAKESGLQWLLQMHKEHGLQFRTYVPILMELLEDADGMVRDTAKSTVIELFREAPNAAKSDLKKQLKNFKVRPAIEQAIVKELNPTATATRVQEQDSRPASAMQTRPNLGASVSSVMSERSSTPAPETRPDSVEPTYVNTQRELDDIFKAMHPWFEGRETEQNWLKREESITKLRRLVAGNASSDYPDFFITACRGLLDGILKAVNSLRTSLSKEGCALVQDLANTFGPGIDPMVELLMQTFIKLCAATKKIASQLANTTVDILIGRVTYNARIMQHIWGASQDKNVQPRTYATGWLKTVLKKEAHHKSHLEHGNSLDLIEKSIKKGLNDPNPGVREKMRSTYWTFAGIWPAKAEAIMDALDSTAQKLLQKDSGNPNSAKRPDPAPRAGLGLSKSTMGSSKPSLREAMLAQKKALTRNLPPRPGSAMATISPTRPARSASGSSNVSGTSAATAPAARVRQDLAAKPHGGMSVAPMRPARRRPDIAARPATAGPYSVRTHDGPSAERASPPGTAKSKAATPKTISGSPRRTVPRPRPGHAKTVSESNVAATPSKPATAVAVASPRGSPAKAKTTLSNLDGMSPPEAISPSQANEDLTLVVPTIADLKEGLPHLSPEIASPRAPAAEEEDNAITPDSPIATPSKPLQVYEDPRMEDGSPPRPLSNSSPERPVLEDKPINEDAASLGRDPIKTDGPQTTPLRAPDKSGQNSRLLESGIARIKAQTLDVHGFRKLQSILRDGRGVALGEETFDALVLGLFRYLESPLLAGGGSGSGSGSLLFASDEKVQDVKAQVLATLKLLLRRDRDRLRPYVSRGLEALLRARAAYDARTHIVSGLELLADELVEIGDPEEMTVTVTRSLNGYGYGHGGGANGISTTNGDDKATTTTTAAAAAAGHRSTSMGLHVLRALMEKKPNQPAFAPTDAEAAALAALAGRCLESRESGVRMDAVQLCVALHARLGDERFWDCMRGALPSSRGNGGNGNSGGGGNSSGSGDSDPKSLITYYVVKRQREQQAAASASAGRSSAGPS